MDIDGLIASKPFLTTDQISTFVREKYHLDVRRITTLGGYDHQNFLIEAAFIDSEAPSTETTEPEVTTYALKITNSFLSRDTQQIGDATRVMDFLHNDGFQCPRSIPDKDGKTYQLATFKNINLRDKTGDTKCLNSREEDTFAVRILSFIPGMPLDDLSIVPYHVFEEIGETLGRIHNALKGFDGHSRLLFRDWGQVVCWSLKRVDLLHDDLIIVKDPLRIKLCRDAIDAFIKNVLQHAEELPAGFLHGDFNDTNILVNSPADESEEIHVAGFIDLDETHYGPLVFDVGIALMYVLQCKTPEPDTAARSFLRGYQRHRTLTNLEVTCLFHCAAARFVQSLVIGLKYHRETGDNLTLMTQARGWDTLEKMWTRDREISYQKWGLS